MNINLDLFFPFVNVRPIPKDQATFRQSTDWTKFSNDNLKFALDVLSLHESLYELDCLTEINRRIDAGTWLDIDQPPPALNNIPPWLKVWPFCLAWKQRPR